MTGIYKNIFTRSNGNSSYSNIMNLINGYFCYNKNI